MKEMHSSNREESQTNYFPWAHQQEYIDLALRNNLPNITVLIAPPGMGRAMSTILLIDRLLKEKGASKILILEEGSLPIANQWWHDLINMAKDVNVTLLSKSVFRELDSFPDIHQGLWKDGIYILPISRSRSDDLRQSIIKNSWNLIVVGLSKNTFNPKVSQSKFLRSILEAHNYDRSVITSTLPLDSSYSWLTSLSDCQIIDWTPLFLNKLKNLPISIRREVITYERTIQEQEILGRLQGISESSPNFRGYLLIDRASSSLYEIENFLLKFVNPLDDSLSLNSHFTKIRNSTEGNKEISQEYEIHSKSEADTLLSEVISEIEEVEDDQKLKCLLRLLADIYQETTDPKIVIVTKYRMTLKYLTSRISQDHENTYQIEGGMTTDTMYFNYENFKRGQNGILICTMAILESWRLDFADNIILYDLPGSMNQMKALEQKFIRFPNPKDVTYHALLDASNVIPAEKQKLIKSGFLANA